ncbi:MBL fold metallo-hydrolase [Alienimonas californiensis]|uniref:Ribonuclease Z n=1 Tax=Alienimonas californiensis TaxID=2527989 RepID=A0A517P9H8_9PLAN|nr:MBL fold metallo-hydrolase [Alienimonas californiensis]QDT16022.1 ribonuclease Z [Alienimonas californiensis]
MPIENLPVHEATLAGFPVEGYGRGAVQSYVRLVEQKLLFDLGGSPWDFQNTPTAFITHGHLDHLAALPVFVARRRMMKMEPPVVYVPAAIRDDVNRMLRSWQKLDRGRMAVDLIGLEPDEEVNLSRELAVTTFATTHTVPSLGYVLWGKKRKLKPEFEGFTQEEIRVEAMKGTEMSGEVREPLVAYTGDTSPAGLFDTDGGADALKAKLLITEMTFFRADHRRDKIHKFGHMHLDDVAEHADRFENEAVLFVHASTRTSDRPFRKAVEKRLPADLWDRTTIWF